MMSKGTFELGGGMILTTKVCLPSNDCRDHILYTKMCDVSFHQASL